MYIRGTLPRWALVALAGMFGCKASAGSERAIDNGNTGGATSPSGAGGTGGGQSSGAGGSGSNGTGGNTSMAANSSTSGGAGGVGAGGKGGSAGMMKVVVPPTPEEPKPCSVAGCPPSLVCASDGVCVTPPPACLKDGDCKSNERCGLTGDCLTMGACKVSADCAMTESCRGGMCMLGSDCGQTELKIEPIPPNILVLLDISGSMCSDLGNCGDDLCIGLCDPMKTKIYIASQAVSQMTSKYHDTIRWGLAEFPGDGACGAPMNVLAPAPDAADMVASRVAATTPAGFTPLNASIASIQSSNYLSDPGRKNYMLLISDGGETCASNNMGAADMDSAKRLGDMAQQGIDTFVVGFGAAVDTMVLDSLAQAGGVPNSAGSTKYFQANSAAELQMALGQILASIVGCDFALAKLPDDPDKVWAFFDGVMVDRDDKNGWKLDTAAMKVTFAGDACMKLQTGTVKDVQVVFGCPMPVQN